MKSTPKNDTNIVPTMLCTTREVYEFSVINNEATDRSPTAATPVQIIYNNTRIQMMYLFIFVVSTCFFLDPIYNTTKLHFWNFFAVLFSLFTSFHGNPHFETFPVLGSE
jgi:hypothetical protein